MADSFVIKFPTLKKELNLVRIADNKVIFDWLVDQMPLKTFMWAPVVAGWSISAMLPTKTPTTWKPGTEVIENLVSMDCGRAYLFMPNGRLVNFCAKYGPITEPMAYPPVAQVAADEMPALVEVGKAIWRSVIWTRDIITAEFVRGN